MKDHCTARTHEKMKEVLMAPEAEGPAVHYYVVRGGSQKTNITVWDSGTVGGEYIKTYGHYHIGRVIEAYQVLQGRGIVIIQERETGKDGRPIDGEIRNFQAISVKSGDRVEIPQNAGHLVVNIGQTWLVTSDNSPLEPETDYEPFKKLHGAAYYVIEKDDKPELVKNPNYKKVPEAKIENI